MVKNEYYEYSKTSHMLFIIQLVTQIAIETCIVLLKFYVQKQVIGNKREQLTTTTFLIKNIKLSES